MTSFEAADKNYQENIKKIPWNADVAKNFSASNKSLNATIDSRLPNFVNMVEQEARGVSGAALQRSAARSAVDSSINSLKNLPNTIDERIAKIDIGGIQNQLRIVEDRIRDEKGKQKQSSTLLEIRKEQTAALIKKYSSNLHSSWLGLWRPLQENTHVGLNVASAFFGILAAALIGYLVYTSYISPAAGTGGGNSIQTNVRNAGNAFMSGLIGGFRKVKNTIN
jgi:hypothetical protein